MSTSFDWSKYEKQTESAQKPDSSFDWSKYENAQPSKLDLVDQAKRAALQYGAGFGGGVGGSVSDVANIANQLNPLQQINGAIEKGISYLLGKEPVEEKKLPGAHELADKIAKDFDVNDPQNSLERISR